MFEITLDEMIYVLAEDMGLTDGVRFIDRTDRTAPKKPFNQGMKPLKRPERNQQETTETGAARDLATEEHPEQPKSSKKKEKEPAKENAAETVERVTEEVEGQSQPKQQQKSSKKKEKEQQPAKEQSTPEAVEHVNGEVEKQPGVSPVPGSEKIIESIINAAFKAAMDSVPGIEKYADEIKAAMNIGDGSIVQQQTPPEEHVTTTPTSSTQIGVNDVVSKFVTSHARPEKLTPKNVYGDALANGKEYTQQIQQTQQAQNRQPAMLDVNAINSYVASLPMEKKDEYIRDCCKDPNSPNMKGLLKTRVQDKKEKLLEFVDFLPREKEDGPRDAYSINLQCIIFALTSDYIKRKLTANGIPENVRFKEVRSTNPRYRFAFTADGEKKRVTAFVNPVPVLIQYNDDAGNIKYNWSVDSVIAVDDIVK